MNMSTNIPCFIEDVVHMYKAIDPNSFCFIEDLIRVSKETDPDTFKGVNDDNVDCSEREDYIPEVQFTEISSERIRSEVAV